MKDLTQSILKRLAHGDTEDEIIFSLCEVEGMKWSEAQALVAMVREEHQVDIAIRQAPLKSILSFALFTGGGLLTIASMVYLWGLLDLTSALLTLINNPSSTEAETAFRLLGSRCALLSWFELPSIFSAMLLGIGIMAANTRFMRGVWDALFRKFKVYE